MNHKQIFIITSDDDELYLEGYLYVLPTEFSGKARFFDVVESQGIYYHIFLANEHDISNEATLKHYIPIPIIEFYENVEFCNEYLDDSQYQIILHWLKATKRF